MSYKPLLSGAVVVEVYKEEYESLVRDSEKIKAVERLFASSEYVTPNDIKALLNIAEKETKETKEREQ